VIDSFGKPTRFNIRFLIKTNKFLNLYFYKSGILQGSVLWLGEYEECMNVTINTLEFRGKYCRISKPSHHGLVYMLIFVLFFLLNKFSNKNINRK
jgi:hypothetical protein